MTIDNKHEREAFTSRIGGLMVVIMTSLGLGNIWRFPYLCAEYGGAAFVVVYLLAIVFVVNIGNQCEICMGKFSRRGVIGAFTAIGRRRIWRICGIIILCLNVVVLVYYNVIISWVVRYFFTSFSGAVWQAASPQAFFDVFIDSPQVIFWAVLVNAIAFGVCWFGIVNGVEKAAKVMGPVLFLVILALVMKTLTLPGVGKGLEYYLVPDWSYLFRYDTWMQAIGQALWSGCFGWGIMTAMGSYMKKGEDTFSTITQAGLLDGAISWLVGLAIIPATVVFNVPLNSGSSLSFLVLPEMFKTMAYGQIYMVLFYGALALSGLGAAIGCLEAILTPLIEEWGFSRKQVISAVFVLWNLAAIPSCLSKNTLDWLDQTIGTYGIDLGGLFILIFVGWAWGADRVRRNVLNYGAVIPVGRWWNVLVKYIAPGFIVFASYGFFKAWLLPSVPASIAWTFIIGIAVLNLVIIYSAIKYPVPQDIDDVSLKTPLPSDKLKV
ncbi:sodium-dependent transporter [Desulfosporosinus youngiae]